VLPDDSIPQADAIVSIGHVLSYLPDPEAIDRALVAIAGALRPGGLLAIDLCDLTYAEAMPGFPIDARVADGWAIITERSAPSPDRFVREMAVFTRKPGRLVAPRRRAPSTACERRSATRSVVASSSSRGSTPSSGTRIHE
jgi:hypothetical protein